MASIEEQLEDSIVERLKAKVPAVDGRIFASVSLQDDDEVITQRPPAILVQCTGSSPDDSQPMGCVEKRRRTFRVSVVFIAQDLRITERSRATVGINNMKSEARKHLQGFKPQGAQSKLEQGEESERGSYAETLLLLWEQEWTVRAYVTAQQ